jgi:large subunit ribosomal protein L25
MPRLTLKAQKRKLLGRKVKKLRKDSILPGNIYGKKVKSKAVKVDLGEFSKVFKEEGETGLIDLLIDKKKLPVLIHNVQVDPVTDEPIHADFLQVNLKEKVVAQIPIELKGESPAEKQGLGIVVQYVDEVEVEALPTDLPENFELDLTSLEKVDDAIQVKDIKIDTKKVDIKEEKERILIKVEAPREEEEEEVAAPEETEAEAEETQESGEETGEETPKEEEKKDSEEK